MAFELAQAPNDGNPSKYEISARLLTGTEVNYQ